MSLVNLLKTADKQNTEVDLKAVFVKAKPLLNKSIRNLFETGSFSSKPVGMGKGVIILITDQRYCILSL